MPTLLAIDIGSSRMKFALGRTSKRSITVSKTFYAQTPPESVNNGDIIDIKRLKEALLVEVQNHKLTGKKTVVTIQSSGFISREFIIPKIKEKDVELTLRFEIEQQMPITLDDYVMSYRELEFIPDPNGGESVKYLVGLMPQRIVSSYFELLKSVKLTPVAMDINSNAIEKLINFGGSESQEKKGVLLLADIGNDAMDMTVFDNGMPQINRTMPIGGAEITRSLARTFGMEMEEAEIKKIQHAMLFDEEGNETDREVSVVAKEVIADWIEQLRRMIDFYMSRHQGKNVDVVYLYGGSSTIKRLDEYLSEVFGTTVRVMSLPENITLKNASPAPVYNFFNAIGALIRR